MKVDSLMKFIINQTMIKNLTHHRQFLLNLISSKLKPLQSTPLTHIYSFNTLLFPCENKLVNSVASGFSTFEKKPSKPNEKSNSTKKTSPINEKTESKPLNVRPSRK